MSRGKSVRRSCYTPAMRKARRPAYPPLPGLALALASCQASSPPAQTPQQPQPEPAVVIASEPQPLVIARDPDSPEPLPPQPAPQPLPPEPAATDSGHIEDPQAVPASCPGDCAMPFRTTGPAVDLDYRVTDGSIPNTRAALEALQPALRACLQAWQPGRTQLQAKVSITARVRNDGTIGAMDVRAAGGADSELTTCVANRVHATRFHAPGAPATLRLIVELSRN